MVDLPSSSLADVDPVFEQMALETGARTLGLSGTSVREVPAVARHDVCRLNLGTAFRMHLMAATKVHGVPYADVLASSASSLRTRAIQRPRTRSARCRRSPGTSGLETEVAADAALD
ncbi:hypothetical protein AB0L64_39935 [Kribbella sp. NPDC051936]|uniref:hypothetical protein n=1 Tax=Kribbella sp. NPDC051936 TaxID=3154946 RepID=UPI00343BBE77